MLRAIYPGSFDPVTYGHIDIMRRSCKIVDELIVGVLSNKAKIPLFSVEERVKMLKEVTKRFGVSESFRLMDFLVEFASRMNAGLVIRGLQAITVILNMNFRCHRQIKNWIREYLRRCF